MKAIEQDAKLLMLPGVIAVYRVLSPPPSCKHLQVLCLAKARCVHMTCGLLLLLSKTGTVACR